jgi:hypothetical protein
LTHGDEPDDNAEWSKKVAAELPSDGPGVLVVHLDIEPSAESVAEQLARCKVTVEAMMTNGRSTMPEYATQRDADLDAADSTGSNISSWPARIWLQSGEVDGAPVYEPGNEITWCADNIETGDVEYVRADIKADLLRALRMMLDAFYEDPLTGNTTVAVDAVDAAYAAIASSEAV